MIISAKLITLLQYIMLGFFQGVTEPLPISSSGHTILLKEFFNIHTPALSFEIVIHFGSLIAIMLMYQKEIRRLARESMFFLTNKNPAYRHSFNYVVYLLLATAVTGVIGLSVESFISDELTTPLTIGCALLITSLFLWIADRKKGERSDQDIKLKDALIIGAIQAVALIPGISRSGTTLIAALMVGMSRTAALRFSFLLFIPVSIGINIMSLKDIVTDPVIQTYFIPYIVACITACITTYFALKWFLKTVRNGKLVFFSLYCFIVGSVVVTYQLFVN